MDEPLKEPQVYKIYRFFFRESNHIFNVYIKSPHANLHGHRKLDAITHDIENLEYFFPVECV